jgi:S-adenosylmethionine:tRNA ribosyltransferase-isomerase
VIAAAFPRPSLLGRVLHLDRRARVPIDLPVSSLPALFGPGDVVVVNDAATFPASLTGAVGAAPVEVRFAGPVDEGWAVLFGAGTWREDTDVRPAPPRVGVGAVVTVLGVDLHVVEVDRTHARLVRLQVPESLVWEAGRPVQYRYVARDLALDEVQTPYASRPWAVEMPSAGRPLTARVIAELRARGAAVVAITHAAGLSATGDPALDAVLPLPERTEVSDGTWDAVQAATRVVAVGTSVVRALETAARGVRAGRTTLRIGPSTKLLAVDALLTNVHAPGESHWELLRAFADDALLAQAHAFASDRGYLAHEFGDHFLIA